MRLEEESGNHREKSVDICVTIITTCGPADNVYTDNEMGVGIGIVSNARPSRFDSRAGKSIVFCAINTCHRSERETRLLTAKVGPRGILISNCKKRIAAPRRAAPYHIASSFHGVCNVFVSRDFAKDYYRNRRAMPTDRQERVNRAQSSLPLKRRDNRK